MFLKMFVFIACFSSFLIQVGPTAEEVFSKIYKEGQVWGVNEDSGTSGSGSSLNSTKIYRQFLKDFLKQFQIHSVVDAGCGDWTFSKNIDWKGIEYIGYDVVASVIKQNEKKFSSPNIHFIHGDIITDDLPEADLLICKDVLQHLTIADIQAFIQQIPKFKYCLITNDVHPSTLSSSNEDISRGEYRPLDLTSAPFFLNGLKILTYRCSWETKQVLLIKN